MPKDVKGEAKASLLDRWPSRFLSCNSWRSSSGTSEIVDDEVEMVEMSRCFFWGGREKQHLCES